MSREGGGETDIDLLLAEIGRLPAEWHGAGSLSQRVLRAVARHAGALPLESSAETGAGKSTLLFSHLSRHHQVFALDHGGSVSVVRSSPLCNRGVVEFIEGPTQLTLPVHRFDRPLQAVLIDGPHGYPFPELEYWHFYPHLIEGALLIIDDIQIPTIHHLYRFLREDEMFTLLEVVETTAFFRRTAAPTFDPCGDGWWQQRYNSRRHPATLRERLAGWLPAGVRRLVRQLLATFANRGMP